MNKTCEQCNIIFEYKKSSRKRRFCCHKCYWENLKGKTRITIKLKLICGQCKKEFLVFPSENKRKFCSMSCKNLSMKGNHYSKNTEFKKKYNMGKNNGHWKGGKPNCIDCGKQLKKYNVLRHRKCYYKFSKIKENHYNWQGGKSFEPYPTMFDRQLKDRIRVRDNFICQLCGVPELECTRRLHVHHIDYVKKNCKDENLISLCVSCNSVVNFKRKHWEEYFKNKIRRLYETETKV